jgi:hypothetical protein
VKAAACIACGLACRARYAVLRARWAWRCRPRWKYRGRPPVPKRGEDQLTFDELRALGNLEAGRDVRTRT